MSDFFQTVLASTRDRIARHRRVLPVNVLRSRSRGQEPPRSFSKALRHPGRVSLIAELKQASPSAGVIRRETDIPGRIRSYVEGGAAALSILTEPDFFHGSPDIFRTARRLARVPLLRKDFIVDPYQVEESRSLGADAILLIVALLPAGVLRDLLDTVVGHGMEALVEVHDEKDLSAAISAGASIIGVNNRNLRTLQVDTRTAHRLIPQIPKYCTIVAESGIKTPQEVSQLRARGAHAVLIGETLMRYGNAKEAVSKFVKVGKNS